jgi:anti-sigma B factor antagonist
MSDDFAIEQDGSATVVVFNGPTLMNLAELERIQRRLEALVDEGMRAVVLDFDKVEFMSSQGIGIILALNKKLKSSRGTGMAICGLTPRLLDLFKITRLEKVLKLMPSRTEAIKSLA